MVADKIVEVYILLVLQNEYFFYLFNSVVLSILFCQYLNYLLQNIRARILSLFQALFFSNEALS